MKLIAFALFVLIVMVPASAGAASCDVSATTGNAADMMLRRQLSALRAIERGRGCKASESRGGLFNACREVAVKISEVQQQLNAGMATDRDCRVNKRATNSAPDRSRVKSVVTQAPTRAVKGEGVFEVARGAKSALQFCVRLTDGYYFPTPNSQFSQKGGVDMALAQCRLICGTQEMAVYRLGDQNEETANMVSIDTGRPYAELPVAYNYHSAGVFKRCDWNGYVAKVGDLMSSRRQSKALTNVVIPFPEPKPADDIAVVSQLAPAASYPVPERVVRMVGPVFIPDSQNKAF